MQNTIPKAQRVVLVGGGHTHALVLKSIAMTPLPDVMITLINPSPKAPYTGMLPGHVAGHYTHSQVEIDLMRLARATNAQIILDEVFGINHIDKKILLNNRPPIQYDLSSINVGITSDLPDIPGFSEFGYAAKPLGEFSVAWTNFLKTASPNKPSNLAVIGAGVAGVELALSMHYRLQRLTKHAPTITIIERGSEALIGTYPRTKNHLANRLRKTNIELITNATINEVTQSYLQLSDGTQIKSDFTVGAAGATPHPWLKTTGLQHEAGFICVDETLTSLTDNSIFAAGDCAHFTPNPLPKAGVFAVRQAPVLLHNLKAALQNKPRRPYKPQKTYLKLISTGGKSAVADKFGLTLGGPHMWVLKDHIDRKFMKRLNTLPKMHAVRSTHDLIAAPVELSQKYDAMCGGCGAKMDSSHLSEILKKQPAKQRADVLSGPGDDAAILQHGTGFQVFTTDHLRAFSNDPWLMGKIAAIHALGDIWAMGAKPQSALASIILPPMADHLHASTLDEILSAATDILRAAGADLVGGHTSIGSELTIGFSITGLSDRYPINNTGAKPGDVLVLTKPLGVGTILAAEMRGEADGYDVEKVYDQMSRSSQIPSQILSQVANAMTDVTGFGLAGHLSQMMTASNTRAVLNLDDIPIIEQAVNYAKNGIKSSLWTSNRKAIADWPHNDTGKAALLFDPQTAGGLLAAIPKADAERILGDLEESGETGHIIGRVEDGPAGIALA